MYSVVVEHIYLLVIVTLISVLQNAFFALKVEKEGNSKNIPTSVFERVRCANRNCMDAYPTFLAVMWCAGLCLNQEFYGPPLHAVPLRHPLSGPSKTMKRNPGLKLLLPLPGSSIWLSGRSTLLDTWAKPLRAPQATCLESVSSSSCSPCALWASSTTCWCTTTAATIRNTWKPSPEPRPLSSSSRSAVCASRWQPRKQSKNNCFSFVFIVFGKNKASRKQMLIPWYKSPQACAIF
ncbi:arachidonate 5-lipoxygenase-activating protein isoform X1 [Gasterosteus aculeatus]